MPVRTGGHRLGHQPDDKGTLAMAAAKHATAADPSRLPADVLDRLADMATTAPHPHLTVPRIPHAAPSGQRPETRA